MEEIARFLHAHPPFDMLPFEAVLALARRIEIAYCAAGEVILAEGGAPAEGLYVVRRGLVDLVRAGEIAPLDTLHPGEAFGHPSLLRHRAPFATVRAREETLAYLLPAPLFYQLCEQFPSFARFFADSLLERLDLALQTRHGDALPELFQTHLSDLVARPIVTVAPEAPVAEAARTMRDNNVSCLLVTCEPPGIVTDRDLRSRVLAAGLPPTVPVQEIMSAPAVTLPATSLVFEGLLLLLEQGIHHLPVTAGGRVIGVVTHTDILRRQSRSPLFLPRQLERAAGPEELRAYGDQVAATVGALLAAGARVSDIGRVVAVAHDGLTVRLLRDAEGALGPPPCPYAWLALGSEGRREQTLRTDQDNALVYADEAPPEAVGYFATLAERVVQGLVACGFPRCPGDIMATNEAWRQPLNVWRSTFGRWIAQPDEEALLRAAIFFDFRRLHGELDVDTALHPVIAQAAGRRVFLARLARAALRHPAPIGLFRQLVLERRGSERDLLDLKLRGTALVVDLARLYALEAGCTATGTIERLLLAAGHSSLESEGAQELAAAFELLSLLRLRHQHAQLQRGETPNNLVALHELTPLERRELKEALRTVARHQEAVAFAFQTERVG